MEKILHGHGDGTVPTYSQIVPPLRWAFQYMKDPTNPLYKPVKFIEYCSKVNRDIDIYDEMGGDTEAEFTQNGYIGLKCECNGSDNYKDCPHATVHGDENTIKFITNVLNAYQKVSEQSLQEIQNLHEKNLNIFNKDCPQLDIEV